MKTINPLDDRVRTSTEKCNLQWKVGIFKYSSVLLVVIFFLFSRKMAVKLHWWNAE